MSFAADGSPSPSSSSASSSSSSTSNNNNNDNNITTTGEPNIIQRMFASSIGAILTALAVTPLDVVKVRMQSSKNIDNNNNSITSTITTKNIIKDGEGGKKMHLAERARCGKCGVYFFSNGLADIPIPLETLGQTAKDKIIFRNINKPISWVGCDHRMTVNPSTFRLIYQISRTEGVSSLYSGLVPSLLMSVPQTVIYFVLYDEFHSFFENSQFGTFLTPVFSGGSARIISSSIVSPIELIRTRIQAMSPKEPSKSFNNIFHEIRSEHGIQGLWRGIGATLWRDVPFSMLYWVSFDQLKKKMNIYFNSNNMNGPVSLREAEGKLSESQSLFLQSFLSGAISGSMASLVTHPFDTVKTLQQVAKTTTTTSTTAAEVVDVGNHSTLEVMKTIMKKEGINGFFTGLGPRIMRIAPSCAIMISSYEGLKRYLSISYS